jgi:hypothetical protein
MRFLGCQAVLEVTDIALKSIVKLALFHAFAWGLAKARESTRAKIVSLA